MGMKNCRLIFILLIICALIISCGDNNNDTGDNNAAEVGVQEEGQASGEPEAEARLLPDLPDSDFGGYIFNFLTHHYDGDDWVSDVPLELIAEEENGEPINDAVYRRNMVLRERYNIDFKITPESDERGALRRAVSAGDDIYDAVIMFNNNVPGIVTADLLLNTDDLPYIDLDKPWWDEATASMSVVNKHYLLAGDLLILDNEATNALLFNKDLMSDLGHPLPYDLVKEGKWTMDALNNLIRGAAADLNGDGQLSHTDDRFGLLLFNDSLHALLVSGGGTLALKDENDVPYMTVMQSRNISIHEKAMELYNPEYSLNIQAINPSTEWTAAYIGSFEENRALFMWVRMRVVEWFRAMESNFGIVPMPKFDEAQANYHSVVNNYTGALMGVPKSADNTERVSIILEALAAESRYTLQPAYYDIVLTRKYTRDEESEEMLGIIFNSRVYDVGAVYGFGDAFIGYINLANSTTSLATYFERAEARMERDIDRVVEIFQAMD